MKNTDIKSIGILRLAALGDVCMTIPLVNALRTKYPNAKIYWIIAAPMATLVDGLEGVELIRINKPKSFADFRKIYHQLRQYKMDVLLAIQASLRSNLICPLIRAKVKYGYGKLHARDMQRLFVNRTVPAVKEHLVDGFMRFAEALGVEKQKPVWNLPIADADLQWAKAQLGEGRYLAICPTASKAERNWDFSRYAEVIKVLRKRWDFKVVLVGGPDPLSRQASEQIEQGIAGGCLNLTGKSSLKQLIAILKYSDALITPDTGPAHIADALGTPVVGLYAVAPPEKTGPYHSLQWVVNKYPEAVRTILQKDPATVSWRQRVHDNAAMQLIQVDDVVTKCDALFAEIVMAPANTALHEV